MIPRIRNVRKLDLREYWKRKGEKAYEEFKATPVKNPACLYDGGLDGDYVQAFVNGYERARKRDIEQTVLEIESASNLA